MIKSPLSPVFQHPFLRAEAEINKSKVAQTFNRWLNVEMCPDFALSLLPFVIKRPFCYIDRDVLDCCLNLLEQDINQTLSALSTQAQPITRAIQSLFRMGTSWDKEMPLSSSEPSDLLLFEQVWHPEYQRYTEHIYNNLIRFPLEILGQKKGKDYQSPALANRVEILEHNGLRKLTQGYNSIVRNAISHGSVTYDELQICYSDKKVDKKLHPMEAATLFDQLVDTCHGFVTAILIFICRNKTVVQQYGLHHLPLGIRFLLVKGIASHRGFEIDAMLETATARGESQLNIYAISLTRSRSIHLFDGTSVAVYAQTMGGNNYDRISVSINCGLPISASLFFRGQELGDALKDGATIDEARKALDTSLLWYDASYLSRKFYTWKTSISLAWDKSYQILISKWRQAGLEVWGSRYLIRDIKNKSVSGIRRLEAEVVLTQDEPITPALIRGVLRHATRKLRRKLIPDLDLEGPGRIRLRPTYIWIRLHKTDARIRTLRSRGWKDTNLLARSEWLSRLWHHHLIFVKKPDTIFRGLYIEYNPELKRTSILGAPGGFAPPCE